MKEEGELLVEANVETFFCNYNCLTGSSAQGGDASHTRHAGIAQLQRISPAPQELKRGLFSATVSNKYGGDNFPLFINIPHPFLV